MKSYTEGRNLYGTLTKNTSAANLLFGDQMANDSYRSIITFKDWPFLEASKKLTTTASTQEYRIPYNVDQIRSVSVTIDSVRYSPRLSPNQEHWDSLNYVSYEQDIPEWYFVFNNRLLLYPTPATTTASAIEYIYKQRVVDLENADYTTGTISAMTNTTVAATVTGSGTSWSRQMDGYYIKVDQTLTGTNSGDNFWYKINSVSTTTSLALETLYSNAGWSGQSNTYTIGQMPLLPEAYQDLPWIYAAAQYWKKEGDNRWMSFMEQYGNFGENGFAPAGRIGELVRNWSSKTTSNVIDDGEDHHQINSNLIINY